MILLSSELASSLHRWEIAEYVAEGFVILGCAGELIALSRRIPRSCRELIETWSTVVLVLALTIGLKCLIKTNELSGMVIGSLGEEAEQAEKKARQAIADSNTALSQSRDALGKAGAAQAALGKAENEANGAQSAAANALTLASGAHREADAFEKEITLAKNDVAILQSLVSARHIIDSTPFEQLKRLKGPYIFTDSISGGEEETYEFCLSILGALKSAGLNAGGGCGGIGGGYIPPGVSVAGPNLSDSELLAKAIREATGTQVVAEPPDPKNPTQYLHVYFGPKKQFWFKK